MKLNEMKLGQTGRITSIDGNARYISRITSIGLTVGSIVEIINNEQKHPVLLYARDTTIALGRTESEKITVEVFK